MAAFEAAYIRGLVKERTHMQGFTYENQGQNTYLVYQFDDRPIDTMALGMLTNNKIKGFAPAIYTEIDNQKFIKYNVSSHVTLSKLFMGDVRKMRLLKTFVNIVDAMQMLDAYMLDRRTIMLDRDYIYVDASTSDVSMICVPVVDEFAPIDEREFFKNIIFSVSFAANENGDYVARILAYLNSVELFQLQDFKKMLEGLDIVVYDIQDIGSRSYTFISTLGLVMRACAENGIEVMVLDRPNPLGGNKIEGCLVEPGFHSFVSEFKIPYIYGLTVGELALLLNEEGLNCGEKGNEAPLKCRLSVIPMEGWTRNMLYQDTNLPWVLPSPNIPYPQSAVNYPSSGITGEFQGYLNIGIGYTLPFEVFAAEWIDADALKALLDSYNLPGVAFRTIHFKPFSGSLQGKLIHGVQFHYTDYEAACCTLTQFYVMQAVNELYPEKNPFALSKGRNNMFDKVCGTDYVRTTFGKRLKVEDIADYWSKDVEAFRTLSRKYRLYN